MTTAQGDDDLIIHLQGRIDLSKAEASKGGLFISEGLGEMELTLLDGDKEIKIKVHKLYFEGVRVESNPEKPT
jgi:hypothetical protein